MKGALLIFVAMILIGIVLYIIDVVYYRKRLPESPEATPDATPGTDEAATLSTADTAADDGICCGMHAVCEKTSLTPLSGEIVYYDDEELDRFRGRAADEYDNEETEEFRDVLMTLLPEDVAGWSRSIQLRGIVLPSEIRDELLMIVSDLRNPA